MALYPLQFAALTSQANDTRILIHGYKEALPSPQAANCPLDMSKSTPLMAKESNRSPHRLTSTHLHPQINTLQRCRGVLFVSVLYVSSASSLR